MNLNLRQLKAFIGVAETGNFTKTAQKVHLTQAALSATIRELEGQLRSRLFERTTRNVVLTDAGRDFLPTAMAVVRDLEAASARLGALERTGVAQLRLGFTPMVAAHVVPGVLQKFQQACPDVQLDVIDDSPQALLGMVDSGEIDAAFGAFFQRASGIRQTPMFPSKLIAAWSPRLMKSHTTLGWSDLSAYPVVALTEASPVQQLVNATLKRQGVEVSLRMAVNNLETAIAMAGKGFGVALIPSFAAAACKRYATLTADITPLVQFDFYRISKIGRETGEALEVFSKEFTQAAGPDAV